MEQSGTSSDETLSRTRKIDFLKHVPVWLGSPSTSHLRLTRPSGPAVESQSLGSRPSSHCQFPFGCGVWFLNVPILLRPLTASAWKQFLFHRPPIHRPPIRRSSIMPKPLTVLYGSSICFIGTSSSLCLPGTRGCPTSLLCFSSCYCLR